MSQISPREWKATATPEGRWWVIAIPDVGVTQSRTLADAGKWASDLVEAMTGTAGAVVHITPVVPGVDIDAIQAARQELTAAEQAIAHASTTIRAAVRAATASGMTQADTAVLLGVSRQRVQQLTRSQRVA